MMNFGFLFRLLLGALVLGGFGLAPAFADAPKEEATPPAVYPAVILVGANHRLPAKQGTTDVWPIHTSLNTKP